MIKAGEVFEYWTVVEQISKSRFKCICRCGTVKELYGSTLELRKSVSCGCLRRGRVPRVGDVLGEWTIVAKDPESVRRVICRCSCGTEKSVEVYTLGKDSLSCGHLRAKDAGEPKDPGKVGRPAKVDPPVPDGHKWCRKCEQAKPAEDFHRNRRKADGLDTYCKECNNARQREAYAKDPAPKIARTRAYHLANPEWSRERLRAHHERNAAERYERHKERGKDPKIREARREAARRSESRRRAIMRGVEADFISREMLEKLLDDYAYSCWICDRQFDGEVVVLHIDHYQPLAHNGSHKLTNLRPACAQCNVRKNGRWPFTETMKEEVARVVLALTD